MGNSLLKAARRAELALTKDKAKTLMAVNGLGVVLTAGVSFKSGMNIQKKIDAGELDKKDILKEIAKMGLAAGGTIAAGVTSYKISAKSIAELTLGLSTAKKEYEALERKMKESLGEEKADEIRKEAQKEIADEKVQETSLMPDITGYFWWKDTFTGSYFYAKESDILRAWTRVSNSLYIGNWVNVDEFYSEIDCKDRMYESSSMAKEFGWNGNMGFDRNCRIILTGTDRLPNEAPCRAFYYSSTPHTR